MTHIRASKRRMEHRGGAAGCGAPELRAPPPLSHSAMCSFLALLLVAAGAWCVLASNAARSLQVNGAQSETASDTAVAVREARDLVKRSRKRAERRLLWDALLMPTLRSSCRT